MTSTRFCVFCGKPPTDKNREHIIPRWLIEMTGDPKRTVRLGWKKVVGKEMEERQFAFDQFVFPACETCNTRYSSLEAQAKTVLQSIVNGSLVEANGLTILLDWFDKVRVGLWLAFHLLDKNFFNIDPAFHIDRRVGQFDRVLIVERSSTDDQFFNIAGTDSPSFAFTPSAFGLSINGWHFTNISYSYLLARRIGFPYPHRLEMTSGGQFSMDLSPGRERVMRPIVQAPLPLNCVAIFQPMFPVGLVSERSDLYDTDYVRENCLDYTQGIGSVFIEQDGKPVYRADPGVQISISPPPMFDRYQQLLKMIVSACCWQNWLDSDRYSLDNLSDEDRDFINNRRRLARNINNKLLRYHKALLKKYKPEVNV